MSESVTDLVFASSLPYVDRLAALVLAFEAKDDGTWIFPTTTARLARMTGLTPNEWRHAVARLEGRGVIELASDGTSLAELAIPEYRFTVEWMTWISATAMTPVAQ